MTFRLWIAILGVAVTTPLIFSRAQAPETRAFTEIFSEDTVVFLRSSDGARLVDAVLGSGVKERLAASAAWQRFLKTPDGQEFTTGVQFITAVTGHSIPDLARKLLDGDVALGLGVPGSGSPQPVLLARPRDPAPLKQILGTIVTLSPDTRQVTHRGVEATIVNGVAFFWEGDTFVLGTDKIVLEGVVERLRGGSSNTLATSPRFRELAGRLDTLGPLRLFVDVARIREARGGRLEALEALPDNPLASLLFGGYRQLLGPSDALVLGLDATPRRIAVRGLSTTSAPGSGHPCYFPTPRIGAVAHPKGTIASLALRRDLSAWWDARLQLVSEKAHGSMARFATDIGNVLGGRDFGEEILALADPGLELLVLPAAPAQGDTPRPEPLLPGFALVVPLESGDGLAPRLQSMFQTLVTFVNIDRAKKDQGPLLLGTTEHRGVTITRAAALEEDPTRGSGIEGNFVPALAVRDGILFIGSHEYAVQQLIDAAITLDRPTPPANGELSVHAAGLEEILAANRRPLIANGVLEGKSVEQATAELDTLLVLIDCFRGLNVTVDTNDPGQLELGIDLEFQGSGAKSASF